MRTVLFEVADRMRDNFPYAHPFYAGQMLKPPHPIARLAYALAQHVNPNNHALDGGRASSAMEKECVADIARMFGWKEFLGHLTSGGTIANLEALWIAGKTRPGMAILASSQAHYTHARISEVLGLDCEKVAVDRFGRMDLEALERRLARGGVGTVVVTLGTTAIGSVDNLEKVLEMRAKYGFRVHVDAAYGGYFTLASNLAPEARSIRTSTVCNPTAAAASCSRTRHSARITSTIRLTRTSARPSYIWARSASSARARAHRPSRCGQRRSCCRS
jgi:glutamate/tyrosine decarboxylase-like PLP-dependent enzyme